MVLVTGGAGFIGSNLIHRLNADGERDILVVDNLRKADKYRNLVDLQFSDYLPKAELFDWLSKHKDDVSAMLHQGACTDTLEYDGEYMLANNFEFSKRLLHFAVELEVPMIYASSAAVYGHARVSVERAECEFPLNVYGYSKLLFDQYVRRHGDGFKNTVVGLRYFNVYGTRETHKERMASMVFQLRNQILQTGVATLFGGAGGCGPGEQTRDFIYVKDILELNLFFLRSDPKQAIVNAGTGCARSWNDLARAVIKSLGKGRIEYIDFPAQLLEKYQFHTEADTKQLRSLGYMREFTSLEDGVSDYFAELSTYESAFTRPA